MQPEQYSSTASDSKTTYDAGLHKHLQRIYNRMTLGVMVTAVTSWLVMSSPVLLKLFMGLHVTPEGTMGIGLQAYVFMFAPAIVLMFGFNPARMSAGKLAMVFFGVCVLYGISFSLIGFYATGENIARAFFMAAASFAGLSIYGYTTKKDLSGMRAFLVMAVSGLFVTSIIGMFFHSPMMHNLIAGAGIFIFSGMIVWKTQEMKMSYNSSHSEEISNRMAWSSALTLYVSFIALFQYILHFLSQR